MPNSEQVETKHDATEYQQKSPQNKWIPYQGVIDTLDKILALETQFAVYKQPQDQKIIPLELHKQVELVEGIDTVLKIKQVFLSMNVIYQEDQQKTLEFTKSKELLENHYDMLRDILRQRWNEIRGTSLDYTQLPKGEANQFCESVARLMWPLPQNLDDLEVGEGPYFLLMPSLKVCKDVSLGENIHTLKLTQFILGSDQTYYIPVADTLIQANSGTGLEGAVAVYNNPTVLETGNIAGIHGEVGKTTILNEEEIHRLTHHSQSTLTYLEQITYAKAEQRKTIAGSLYQALELVMLGMRAGGHTADDATIQAYAMASNLDFAALKAQRPGVEDEAGPVAIQAVINFSYIWNAYTADEKKLLLTKYPNFSLTNHSTAGGLGYFITMASRTFAINTFELRQVLERDDLEVRPCVEILATSLSTFLSYRRDDLMQEPLPQAHFKEEKHEGSEESCQPINHAFSQTLREDTYKPFRNTAVRDELLQHCLARPNVIKEAAFTVQTPSFLMLCLDDRDHRYVDKLPLVIQHSPNEDFRYLNAAGLSVLDIAIVHHEDLLTDLFKRLVTLDEAIQTDMLSYPSRRDGTPYPNMIQFLETNYPNLLDEITQVPDAKPKAEMERVIAKLKMTWLMEAIQKGHVDQVKIYLNEMDVNCKGPEGTPLVVAIRHKQEGVLNLLLEHGAKLIDEKDTNALYVAQVNAPTMLPTLLLHVLKLPLEEQIDLFTFEDKNILNYIYKHHRPLLATIEKNKDQYNLSEAQHIQLKALIQQDIQQKSLFKAIENREYKAIDEMVQLDPNVINLKDENGSTPLIAAIYHHKDLELVKFLISQKADLYPYNKQIQGALEFCFNSAWDKQESQLQIRGYLLAHLIQHMAPDEQKRVMQQNELSFDSIKTYVYSESLSCLTSVLLHVNLFQDPQEKQKVMEYFKSEWIEAVEKHETSTAKKLANVFPEFINSQFFRGETALAYWFSERETKEEVFSYRDDETLEDFYKKKYKYDNLDIVDGFINELLFRSPNLFAPIHVLNAILNLHDHESLLSTALKIAAYQDIRATFQFTKTNCPKYMETLVTLPNLPKGSEELLQALKNNQLLECIRNNDVPGVSKLIEQKADVNTLDKNNKTPLTLAFYQGNRELFQLLLKHDTYFSYPTEYKHILKDAMQDPKAKDMLPEVIIRIAKYNAKYQSAFLEDIKKKDSWATYNNMLEFVIEQYPICLPQFLQAKTWPARGSEERKKILAAHISLLVSRAIQPGGSAFLRILMEESIGISSCTMEGLTLLTKMVAAQNDEAVNVLLNDKRCLLSRGTKETKERNVLDFAIKNQPKYLPALLSRALMFDPDDQKEFLRKTQSNHESVLGYILEVQSVHLPKIIENLNQNDPESLASLKEALQMPDDTGNTPLLDAIIKRDFRLARTLLDLGVSLENRDAEGRNALKLAQNEPSFFPEMLRAAQKLSKEAQAELFEGFSADNYTGVEDYLKAHPEINLNKSLAHRPSTQPNRNRFIGKPKEQKEVPPEQSQRQTTMLGCTGETTTLTA